MRKSTFGEKKRQGGISLIPALWDAIDEAARLAGVPRNQVMERALMERFGLLSEYRISGANSRSSVVAAEMELE